MRFVSAGLLLLILSSIAAADPLVIEDLGQPVVRRTLGMRCVTRDAAGVQEAWGSFETYDRFALVGAWLDNGNHGTVFAGATVRGDGRGSGR